MQIWLLSVFTYLLVILFQIIAFCFFFSQWLNKGLLLSLEKYSKANIHIGLSRCAPNYDMFLYFDSDFKNS